MSSPHTPVLLNEVLEALAPRDSAIYLDGTFGAGGYSQAILDKAQCQVVALDRDASVMPYATELASRYGKRFCFINGNFGNMQQLLRSNGYDQIDGVVLDIGVSSMQLAQAERGFSFMNDGPLDMRMDNSQIRTAAAIVSEYNEQELADLFFTYGGERKSRRIAHAIVTARQQAPIRSTLQLANIVKGAVSRYHDAIHPATRTFQALRIEVNNELKELELGLQEAVALLAPLGRLVVVTFHSLEDAIVKRCFMKLCGKKVHTNKYKSEEYAPSHAFCHISNGAVAPSRSETYANPRARSAKLRAIVRSA